METQYVYSKSRKDFGKQCIFWDSKPLLIDNYPPKKQLYERYILEDPTSKHTQFSKLQAEHEVNTVRVQYADRGVNHSEGGWPKDINYLDEEQTIRYRRKIEKDDMYIHSVLQLAHSMEHYIMQNNAINIYEYYYEDVETMPQVEKTSARTVNVYRHPSGTRHGNVGGHYSSPRPITRISWLPDDGTRIAVTYCNMKFQAKTSFGNPDNDCYIWDIENPNHPETILISPMNPCCCLEYNPKDPHILGGGMFSGQIAIWDIRKGVEPLQFTLIENSHRDPVNNLIWINSKSGTEFFTASTDGQLKWWDTRKLDEPMETLILDIESKNEQSISKALGVSCLEYEPTIPTRFMVGTENGMIISGNRKGKTPQEKLPVRISGHVGPVLALERNPSCIKNFITVGEWTARIWSEECRESSIAWTGTYKTLLNDAAWSTTRTSVFFIIREDGILDAWDLLQSLETPNISVKASDFPLTKIKPHENGKLIALGNSDGTLYLTEFSDNLAENTKNDKAVFISNMERESRREKILEARLREIKLKRQQQQQNIVEQKKEMPGEEEDKIELNLMVDEICIEAEKEYFSEIEKEIKSKDKSITLEELEEDKYDSLEEEEELNFENEIFEVKTDTPLKKSKKKSKKAKKK